DTRWLRIAGVRSTRGSGQVLCWSEIYVPDRFAPPRDRLRQPDRAIYERVLEQHGLKLEYVEQDVGAAALPGPIAELLGAEPDSPALM
ncbi:UTRA domain-containing protein, partial [Acinetobacter baumannii]|uniref:UTRA domain-containing protein n=1 Tax=Acinetobacter baumannii TaxID=470 RepID=UPI0013D38F9C